MTASDDGGAEQVSAAVAAAHREHWARVVAAAARVSGGNLAVAEDAAADAFAQALQTWGTRGVPDNPAGWLIRTAHGKVVDQQRREATLRRKLPLLAASEAPSLPDATEEVPDVVALDDRLRLVFTCCHPALAMEARVALTLRLIGGLTTQEIASALLVSDSAMAARLTRAKSKIAAARIPYRVPPDAELIDRLDGVLTVTHLIATTGHTAPSGSGLGRSDLQTRGLDLARMLAALLPDEPEVLGLLALLELTAAREPARVAADGSVVLLAEQDRNHWDGELVDLGLRHLQLAGTRLGPTRQPGRFLLQAGIAAVHAEADDFAATDWTAIVALYDRLQERWPSPVVTLNRAVAVGYADGPHAGLDALAAIAADPRLARYHYLPAARARMLDQLGRVGEARAAYAEALSLVGNDAERRWLADRLAALDSAQR